MAGIHESGTGDGGGMVGIWDVEGPDGVRDTGWNWCWQEDNEDMGNGRRAPERTDC